MAKAKRKLPKLFRLKCKHVRVTSWDIPTFVDPDIADLGSKRRRAKRSERFNNGKDRN